MGKKEKKKVKKSTFWSDFKNFITKGNVIDLAVAVIIGNAFSAIVNGLVQNIINPILGKFIMNGSLDNLKTVITPEVLNDANEVVQKEVAILWGTWIQSIINFLIIALCVFMVLRILTKVQTNLHNLIHEKQIAEEAEKAKAKKEEEEKAKLEALLKAEVENKKQDEYRNSVMEQNTLLKEILAELKNK